MGGLRAKNAGVTPVAMAGVGSFGYYAGPKVYIIDLHALTDPSRARFPAVDGLRVGHYQRQIPAGYWQTIAGGYANHIEEPNLRSYYDKISILVHGDLLARSRLETIVDFNL